MKHSVLCTMQFLCKKEVEKKPIKSKAENLANLEYHCACNKTDQNVTKQFKAIL